MSVLIAGGCGFIGSHLARKLVETGEQVILFDLAPNTDMIKDIVDRVKLIRGDATNMLDILHALRDNRVEVVYHLIGLLADISEVKPSLALKVNVVSLLHFLEASRILNPGRIVFASSVAVYDPLAQAPVGEAAPLRPRSVYGATKVLSEFYGMHFNRLFGVDFRALRFTTLYGLGKSGGSTGVCSLMIEKSALGEAVRGEVADAVTDWLYIKDAVNSLILARKVDQPRERIYNIGGSSHSVKEVADIVGRMLPESNIQLDAKKTFPWPPAYDCAAAQRELGYTPAFTIKEGVEDFIQETKKKYGVNKP
jgi:nucleoside-diphosphate-sugar epimerase